MADLSADRSTSASALEKIARDTLQSRRLNALNRFCASLDAEGVRRELATLPGDQTANRWEARERLISRWAELEPAAAAAFALGMRDRNYGNLALQSVLKVWLSNDADTAKQYVATLQPKEAFFGVMWNFTASIAARDLGEALRFSGTVPAAYQRNVVWAAFRAAADVDAASAVARAMSMPAGTLRESAVESAASVWAQKDPAAALAWLQQHPDLPSRNGGSLLPTAIWSLAYMDPAAAAHFVEKLPEGKLREDLITRVASAGSWKDHALTFRWVESLPESEAKSTALQSVISRWGGHDPLAAAEYLAAMPLTDKTRETMQSVARSWAAFDPEGALAWLAKQPNGAMERDVAGRVLGALAGDNPARAIQALTSLRTVEGRRSAIGEIAGTWAERDAPGAAQWLLQMPAAEAGDEGLSEVVRLGTNRDPVAMAHWLEDLKGHPRRDVAVEAFVEAADSYDPLVAATWARTISDIKKRESVVENLVSQHAIYDAAGVREWVLGQNFASAERENLLKRIDAAQKKR